VPESEEEIAYYRAIEDFFATVRGVPHTLSPRDFQLLREWWRDQIPLPAVTSGITEVMAKRRSRDEDATVVSLSYCRHAVRRQANRLARMHTGESRPDLGPHEAAAPSLQTLTEQLIEISTEWRRLNPELADVIDQIAGQLTRATGLPPALLEEHLFAIETVMLDLCWRVLPMEQQKTIEEVSRDAAETSGGADSTRDRTYRAIRDRELRKLLGLPRLELG
jgi:hypothetical protein